MNKSKLKKLNEDPLLKPFKKEINLRKEHFSFVEKKITEEKMDILGFSNAHEYFGLHRKNDHWIFREWAPNATAIYLIGDFTEWELSDEFALSYGDKHGVWEIEIPIDIINHEDLFKLQIYWPGGSGERLPAYSRRVVQDPETYIFSAQVWEPLNSYEWKANKKEICNDRPLIYEAHIGMAQEEGKVGSYKEFEDKILPRIIKSGYNTIQLMGIMEHPYYGSFGYHVSNFFSPSSRFGTPDDLKKLIDACHKSKIRVIIDLIHSHSVKNEVEGLARFDGSTYQYFHSGARGYHDAWDSKCFDYGKPEVIHFLLSNIKYWMDEFKLDGFRFDGITSMLYHHRGLGTTFPDYHSYFDGNLDLDAFSYLALANKLIHSINNEAITIAEDVSGLPGIGAPIEDGGCGFDYSLSMGSPDCWFYLTSEVPDEEWEMGYLFHKLTEKRPDEKVISYVESHDQAFVGGKTLIFQLIDKEMYFNMHASAKNISVDRGVALHKMARLATILSAGDGYLNFMGNEFGHPEWIDFPREGNNWTYHYARRQWSIRDDKNLKFHFLGNFDEALINLSKKENVLEYNISKQQIDEDNKIITFERGNLLICLNFHVKNSQLDYPINVSGIKYELILNSDNPKFGGHDILKNIEPYEATIKNKKNIIKTYIPARTGIVLKRIKD